jgi:hypothetical protein
MTVPRKHLHPVGTSANCREPMLALLRHDGSLPDAEEQAGNQLWTITRAA